MSPTVIAITPGDSAGIGPEVIRAALADPALDRAGVEHRVLGSLEGGPAGEPSPATARAALEAMEAAAELAVSGRAAAVVAGPICKHRMQEIGFAFPGQTEFFASRAGVSDFAMLLTGGRITVALVTAHIPLSEVSRRVTKAEIQRVGLLLVNFLERTGLTVPRIAVAGLNPHAGEAGVLGREEIEIIAPAIEALGRSAGGRAVFDGPIPPDTLFFRLAAGEWNAALVMYHDQGLIPLKLHAFDRGVNVTLGLPFARTSPDHGTAFEIAGKGLARHESMLCALNLAAALARHRASPG